MLVQRLPKQRLDEDASEFEVENNESKEVVPVASPSPQPCANSAVPYAFPPNPQLMFAQPNLVQQPAYHPMFPQPMYSQPQPMFTQPMFNQPMFPQPMAPQPMFSQPMFPQPMFAQPMAQPMFAQPMASQPPQPMFQPPHPMFQPPQPMFQPPQPMSQPPQLMASQPPQLMASQPQLTATPSMSDFGSLNAGPLVEQQAAKTASVAEVPPPYASVTAPAQASVQQRMSLSEWLEAHGLQAYLERLQAEDVHELSHFQDLTDDDVQSLVDQWNMPLRTKRTFLSAVEVLRQTQASPPCYDEPVLETKAGDLELQLAELVENEDEQAILKLMTSQAKVQSVQEKCIEALLVLARSDVTKADLVEADVHRALLDVLRRHTRAVKLLESASGALWHIALFADYEKGEFHYRDHSNDSNKEMLVALGVPAVLMCALKDHPESAKLARRSLGLLWSLATCDAGKEALLELGVASMVVSIMLLHERDQLVQVNGCGFLWSLTSRKTPLSPTDVPGCREVVEAALAAFPQSKQVQKYAQLALRKLPV